MNKMLSCLASFVVFDSLLDTYWRPIYTERECTPQLAARFPSQFAVLIDSGFLTINRNPIRIRTQSFSNINYYNARIINLETACLLPGIPPYCRSCSLFGISILI